MKSMLIDLMATSFLVSLCRPRLTLPKAPLPSILPILYSSSWVFGGLLYFEKQSTMSCLMRQTSFDLGLSWETLCCLMFCIIYLVVAFPMSGVWCYYLTVDIIVFKVSSFSYYISFIYKFISYSIISSYLALSIDPSLGESIYAYLLNFTAFFLF